MVARPQYVDARSGLKREIMTEAYSRCDNLLSRCAIDESLRLEMRVYQETIVSSHVTKV